MLGEWTDLFAIFGITKVFTAVGCFVVLLGYDIKLKIEDWMYDWRVRHRFDKPPTAKCYCRDCQYHDPESHRCYRFHENSNRRTGDACFCCEAEPRKRKDEVK